MKRIAAVVVALSAVTVGSVAHSGPTARASVGTLWSKLGQYEHSYLQDWLTVTDPEDRSSEAALDAFREVAYQISGPTGLWRREVALSWFGCVAFPESAACRALAEATPELERWDAMVTRTLRLNRSGARRYLRWNAAKLEAYLDRYVPRGAGMDAAMATPFFRDRLAPVAGLAPLDEEDLPGMPPL